MRPDDVDRKAEALAQMAVEVVLHDQRETTGLGPIRIIALNIADAIRTTTTTPTWTRTPPATPGWYACKFGYGDIEEPTVVRIFETPTGLAYRDDEDYTYWVKNSSFQFWYGPFEIPA